VSTIDSGGRQLAKRKLMKLLGMVISGFQRAGGAMEVDHIGWRWRKNFLVLKKIKVEFDGIVTKINVVRGKVMQTSCSYC